MSVETKPVDTADTFEGEETLGAELREKSSSLEIDTTDIYPDAVVNNSQAYCVKHATP